MNKFMVGGIVLGIMVILTIGFIFAQYMGSASYGNKQENLLMAVWENNENILSQFKLKVGEMAQVTDMARDDLKDIVEASIGGRYGDDGLQASWAWIKEQNPSVDPSLYQNLTQAFQSGRKDFEIAQTKLIDVKRGYRDKLGGPWSGLWLRFAGYPHLNVGFPLGSQDDYAIISSAGAQKAFETGVDEVTKLR